MDAPDDTNAANAESTAPKGRPLGRRTIAAIAIAILASGALLVLLLFGDALNRYFRFERTEIERVVNGEMCRGWQFQARGATDDLEQVHVQLWSPTTGFLVYDSSTLRNDAGDVQTTVWDRQGKLIQQTVFSEDFRSTFKLEPPWDWGFEDQEAPSAPSQFLGPGSSAGPR